MTAFFFDTSALIKRYVQERGTAWVLTVTDATTGNDIYITRLTEVEVTAAVTRRTRGGTLSSTDGFTVIMHFLDDLARQYQTVELLDAVLTTAMDLAARHGLRALDAVQLAAALNLEAIRAESSLQPLTFVSADRELSAAAVAEGLVVDDPAAHP